jgi:hypothetical protein
MLLWSGSPQRKLRFEQKHVPLLFIIPFCLFFLLIPIAGMFDGGTSDQSKASQDQAQSATVNQTTATSKPQKPETLAYRIIFSIGASPQHPLIHPLLSRHGVLLSSL